MPLLPLSPAGASKLARPRLTSGIFDRVVLGPTWALIDDFKTDHATDPSLLRDRHTPQLHTYRSALAQLTGLPEAAITCRLVLVRTGELVEVEG